MTRAEMQAALRDTGRCGAFLTTKRGLCRASASDAAGRCGNHEGAA